MDDLHNLDFRDQTAGKPAFKGKTAFDYLATPSSSSSRSVSPVSLPKTSPAPPKSSTPVGQDAFAELFAPSPAPRSASNTPVASLSPPNVAAAAPDPWDFELLTTNTSPQPSAQSVGDEFDFLGLGAPRAPAGQATPLPATTNDDSFELLFDRVPPVEPVQPLVDTPGNYPRLDGPQPPNPRSQHDGSSSPPPHVLGQLVEMGFGIDEAKKALQMTSRSGEYNVEAAAESILARDNSRSSPDPPASSRRPNSILPQQPDRLTQKNSDQELHTRLVPEQLLAQASEIGLNVFKTANAYWRTSKKAVKKALDEHVQSTTESADARPKWMRQTSEDRPRESRPKWMSPESGYEDISSAPSTSARSKPHDFFSDQADAASLTSAQPQSGNNRVKAAPEPKIYQSANRRRVPQRSSPAPSLASTTVSLAAVKPRSGYERPQVKASEQALASASKLRAQGNAHFKLGRYGDAEASYTSALEVLPDAHLFRLPLFNNRASARLKNGQERAAVEDASAILLVVFGTRDIPHLDPAAPELETAGDINLREVVGKALSKRAQGLEAVENWAAAEKDWQLLLRAGGPFLKVAGGMNVVSEGLKRCRKATQPKPPPTKAKSVATPSAQKSDGQAVKALRVATNQAEAEDAQKFSLKDSVDGRVAAWKNGKEKNIRALVSSLETVLWPELGWKKVGMHELVTDSQLKIRYMKAIARLHPDKLNASNTTVEQRMIANSVFSALNDAWNAQ